MLVRRIITQAVILKGLTVAHRSPIHLRGRVHCASIVLFGTLTLPKRQYEVNVSVVSCKATVENH